MEFTSSSSSDIGETRNKRCEETTIACPIVYGNSAFYLGKKAHETATHRWTLFVRSPNGEDLSVFVSKVAFSLHESFAEPVRVVEKAPFEVTELGWGEFAAKIRIFFRDPEEQPVDIVHVIKLYPTGSSAASASQSALQANIKKPVMSETYDEVVFVDPTEGFRDHLMRYTPPTEEQQTATLEASRLRLLDPNAAPVKEDYFSLFDPDRDLIAIKSAGEYIARETELAMSRLVQLEAESDFLQTSLDTK